MNIPTRQHYWSSIEGTAFAAPRDRLPVVLLTATVTPRNVPFLKRSDWRVRLSDYKVALQSWLTSRVSTDIVFCENSAFDLSELSWICSRATEFTGRIEMLSFSDSDYDSARGKGFGELNIISWALKNSALLRSANRVLKVTGRIYVRNVNRLIGEIHKQSKPEVFCDLRRNLTFADSRVFCATQKFLREFLLPMHGIVNDTAGVYFENALARAVHSALSVGLRWAPLPRVPDLEGVSGTLDVKYRRDILSRARREVLHQAKGLILKL